jgi:hypothetical protein
LSAGWIYDNLEGERYIPAAVPGGPRPTEVFK